MNTIEPMQAAGIDPAARPPGAEGKTVRILYVEDHQDTAKVMRILLERRGYSVVTASTIASAVEIARETDLDLIICDIGLPDGSGHELINQISAARPVKAIALSGYGLQQDVERSLEVGFSAHLVKPVSQKQLLETIQKVTEG